MFIFCKFYINIGKSIGFNGYIATLITEEHLDLGKGNIPILGLDTKVHFLTILLLIPLIIIKLPATDFSICTLNLPQEYYRFVILTGKILSGWPEI